MVLIRSSRQYDNESSEKTLVNGVCPYFFVCVCVFFLYVCVCGNFIAGQLQLDQLLEAVDSTAVGTARTLFTRIYN